MANEELDALLCEDLPELVGDVLVQEGADVVHVLDDSHLSAQAIINGGHFDSDDTSSDDY